MTNRPARPPLRTMPARVKPAVSPFTLRPALLHDEQQRDRSRAYERLRLSVLREACYLCQCFECTSTGRVRPASHVDHVVPLWAGGTNERYNLQALNPDCHARKSAQEAANRAAGPQIAPGSTNGDAPPLHPAPRPDRAL